MSGRPVALDLCSGLGGWADGLEAEGWEVIRVDIVDMFAQVGWPKPQDCHLILQDIRTFHGSQARRCNLIVASPPCTEFSWMAMPWSRAKQVERALRGEDEFPIGYRGSRTIKDLTALFEACFRIQREASEAAGHRIPLIVENVRGAQKWVGRARFNFGSFYLWGDVPALMPPISKRAILKAGITHRGDGSTNFHGHKTPGFRFDGSGRSFQSNAVEATGYKSQGMNWSDQTRRGQDFTRIAGEQAIKNNGGSWSNVAAARHYGQMVEGVRIERTAEDKRQHIGTSRKFASAMIAKIPLPLSLYIAATFLPRNDERPA